MYILNKYIDTFHPQVGNATNPALAVAGDTRRTSAKPVSIQTAQRRGKLALNGAAEIPLSVAKTPHQRKTSAFFQKFVHFSFRREKKMF